MKSFIFAACLLAALMLSAKEKYTAVPGSAEEVPVPSFININSPDLADAPDEHEIVTGDTLWDLSGKYLKSPWYWPKVWSMNPQIKNPHLIYPGDKLQFRGSGEMVVQSSNTVSDLDSDDNASSGKTLDSKPENYKDFVGLGGKYRIDRFKNSEDTAYDIVKKGFVTTGELKDTSEVIGSFEPKEMLATEDNCYIKLGEKALNVGEYVEFIRKSETIIHPATNEAFGIKVQILGKGKVIEVNKDHIATVKIVKAYDSILRGDLVRLFEESEKSVKIKEASGEKVNARILTNYDSGTIYGETYIVYLDKGSNAGLSEGNMMTVYRKGDGLASIEDEETAVKLPFEAIGELVIVKTSETTSVAMITKSLIDLQRGDFVSTGGLE